MLLIVKDLVELLYCGTIAVATIFVLYCVIERNNSCR